MNSKDKKTMMIAILVAVIILAFAIPIFFNTVLPSADEKTCANIVAQFAKELKDPDSMVITSDILRAKVESGAEVWCFRYNAKNGFGAYVGNEKVEIYAMNGEPFFYAREGSTEFANFQYMLEEVAEKGYSELDCKKFNGKRIANLANVSYGG